MSPSPVSRLAIFITLLVLTAILLYPYVNAEWGRPLGPSYSGPEVQPRGPIAVPLSPDAFFYSLVNHFLNQ